MKTPGLLSPSIAVLLLASGCVTNIKSDVTQNPPPAEKFANFSRIEMTPVTLVPPYAGQEANERALSKIQENVSLKMSPAVQAWNGRALTGGTPRTLQIVPTVTEIKFIGGATRFWGGALAGSSAVVLRAQITEKETGKVIATPEFYARAAAMGGAYSMGGTDNAMLVRIATRLTDYLLANFDQAVGGPSGAEPPEKK